MRTNVVGLLLAVALAGCQSTAPVPADGIDWLHRLAPWPGPDQHWLQLVTFSDRHNEAVHVLRVDVAFRAGTVTLNGQTTLGVPLFVVRLVAGRVTVDRHSAAPPGLPVEQALADFVLAVWPVEALSAALVGSGYTVRADDDRRQLLNRQGELLIEIKGSGESLLVDHHDIPLSVKIDTLERHLRDS